MDIVARNAAVALHRRVTITRIVDEGVVTTLQARISARPELRDAIRSADLITITIGVNQIAQAAFRVTPGGCGSDDGSACVARAERDFETSYGSMLAQLTRLRPSSKAAYRLLTSYDIAGLFRGSARTAFSAALRAKNRYTCAQAARRRMRCVDVYAAFNGADGSRDPRESGLIVADGHPSARGSATIAKLILATGVAQPL